MCPVLGLVENMSFYCCPNCGHRADIFGHGGAKAEAAHLGAEFLGEIPLLLDIRVASDAGTPIAASAPDSDAAKAYGALAARVWEKVSGSTVGAQQRPADRYPIIVVSQGLPIRIYPHCAGASGRFMVIMSAP